MGGGTGAGDGVKTFTGGGGTGAGVSAGITGVGGLAAGIGLATGLAEGAGLALGVGLAATGSARATGARLEGDFSVDSIAVAASASGVAFVVDVARLRSATIWA